MSDIGERNTSKILLWRYKGMVIINRSGISYPRKFWGRLIPSSSSSSSSSCHPTSADFPDSLFLSRFVSYHPLLPAELLDYILGPYRAVVDKFWLVSQHRYWCERVHRKTSILSSSLLLQQCLACLVRLIWVVLQVNGPNAAVSWDLASKICLI